ncbi:MAG: FtsW/RodA/SpoVE family cell cycle protein [Acidimicrobiia bacterium]|nr:FtsW/RodA/SpoVE family cell cycle protein [Acidimicrobiia bacterium]
MSRTAEAVLILVATGLAGLGTVLVNLTQGSGFDAQVVVTIAAFLVGFGGFGLAVRRFAPAANPFLIPLVTFLAAIGFTELYRLDPSRAAVQRWSIVVAGGIASAVLFALRSEGVAVLRRYRYVFAITALGLWMLPLTPLGVEVNGSRLWLRLTVPGTSVTASFQPGEIAKLLLVAFLASYLAERHESLANMRRSIGRLLLPRPSQLGPVFLAFIVSFGVLIYQRDLGASLLLFGVVVAMLYAATSQASYLAFGGLLVAGGGVVAYQMFDHVQRRVSAWLYPFDDFTGAGYQVAQGLFAFGSGSLTGSGIGVGRPDLIPAAATDYIFAAIAEEMGLAGSVATLAGFALLFAVGFGISVRSRDVFRKLMAAGLVLVLGIQTILILAGVMRLFPVTGITLPFMSYGGSSLIANLVLIALLARISHEERT